MSARVVAIVQARMGSTRFPGKSMADLAGRPLLWRVLERLKRATQLNAIVMATTELPQDDVLIQVASDCHVEVFRGAEIDLVDRYYEAAKAARADHIVRFPADNPVPEPSEIDRIVEFHMTGQSEFSSNLAEVFGNGYPDGIGAEVFRFGDLEYVWRTVADPERREHPHLNFFDYKRQMAVAPDRWRVGTVQCPAEFRRPDLVLDVNTPQQYGFMRALYEYLYPRNPAFHITDIIAWYDQVYGADQAYRAGAGL